MTTNNREALTALAGALSLESLDFDSDNVCELVFDEDSIVTLEGEPDGTRLQINGFVGDLPDAASPAALQTLLQANFNGQGVGAASLGMDHVSHEVVLGQQVEVDRLGETGLAGVLEAFVNHLIFWQGELPKLGQSDTGDASADISAGHMHV